MPRIASYANIASTLALLVALSGTAYAAATITGKDVKDGSLTGKDLKDSSISGTDVKEGSIVGRDIKDGTIRNLDLFPGVLPGAAAAITAGGDVAIPAGQVDAYVFDTEVYDSAVMYDSGAYLTIPRPGIYQLSAAICFAGSGQHGRQVRILVDDQVVALGSLGPDAPNVSVTATVTLRLDVNDRISLGTYNGGAATTVADFGGTAPDALLTAQMVSP